MACGVPLLVRKLTEFCFERAFLPFRSVALKKTVAYAGQLRGGIERSLPKIVWVTRPTEETQAHEGTTLEEGLESPSQNGDRGKR